MFVESDSVTLWTEKKVLKKFSETPIRKVKGKQGSKLRGKKKNSLKFLEGMPIRKMNKADGKP